jgi:hypothetical protein
LLRQLPTSTLLNAFTPTGITLAGGTSVILITLGVIAIWTNRR